MSSSTTSGVGGTYMGAMPYVSSLNLVNLGRSSPRGLARGLGR
jgi:hypothetical protein